MWVQIIDNKYMKLRTTVSWLWYGAPGQETKWLDLISSKKKALRERFTNGCFDNMYCHVFGTIQSHDVPITWSFSSWRRCYTAVLMPKASKPLDIESRSDSLDSAFARFYSVWLVLMGISEKVCVPLVPHSRKRNKRNYHAGHSNRWQKYVEQHIQKHGKSFLLRVESKAVISNNFSTE